MGVKTPLEFKVVDIKQIAEDVKELRFEPLQEGFDFNFIPGQFVNLFIVKPDAPIMARPYSISSPPGVNYLELAIKIMPKGTLTPLVNQLKVGDVVKISGPFGNFVLEDRMKELVFIGGGTGVTPFISMIRYANMNKLPIKMTYIYSCRTPEFILFYDELQSISQSNKFVEVIFTCTRETPPDWKGEKGRVSADMIKKYVEVGNSDQYFMLCGPKPMVESSVEILRELGVAEDHILRESWS